MQNDKRRSPDWAAIEIEFTETTISVRELARRLSISEGAIRKKAKANGWVRPSAESTHRESRRPPATVPTLIQASALDVSAILGRGRNLITRLLSELEDATAHVGQLHEMIEAETADDKDSKRRSALYKAISLPVRAGAIKNLAIALKGLNKMAESRCSKVGDGV